MRSPLNLADLVDDNSAKHVRPTSERKHEILLCSLEISISNWGLTNFWITSRFMVPLFRKVVRIPANLINCKLFWRISCFARLSSLIVLVQLATGRDVKNFLQKQFNYLTITVTTFIKSDTDHVLYSWVMIHLVLSTSTSLQRIIYNLQRLPTTTLHRNIHHSLWSSY